ncbi:MAG TPA: BrnA antitoxin family protein [Hydrogenophaga sp.]|uniref:BrnA antitoxin family protein n=1 Tax=Hydrogenophaga sp. TaxID=1904254 RepID=UPI002CB15779|nr:BrnA antitoxin family protein [Hydrogenophaga sp.]HSX92656.1 BrnA antitoxin family protein [Hydrogenophaga sp.]
MRITYDPGKRQRALTERGLDFEDAATVFDGHTFEVEDVRKDYACERPMPVSKNVSPRTLGSDLKRSDAHRIRPREYQELPELTDDMLERGVVRKAGRPRSEQPKQLISLRLPPDVIERWRATGPGWQTRMAERLARVPLPGEKSRR